MNAEPDSVVLTQAKFPVDLGDCRSGTHLSPNPDQGFEEYQKLADVHIETIYSFEAISHYFVSDLEVLKLHTKPADKIDAFVVVPTSCDHCPLSIGSCNLNV